MPRWQPGHPSGSIHIVAVARSPLHILLWPTTAHSASYAAARRAQRPLPSQGRSDHATTAPPARARSRANSPHTCYALRRSACTPRAMSHTAHAKQHGQQRLRAFSERATRAAQVRPGRATPGRATSHSQNTHEARPQEAAHEDSRSLPRNQEHRVHRTALSALPCCAASTCAPSCALALAAPAGREVCAVAVCAIPAASSAVRSSHMRPARMRIGIPGVACCVAWCGWRRGWRRGGGRWPRAHRARTHLRRPAEEKAKNGTDGACQKAAEQRQTSGRPRSHAAAEARQKGWKRGRTTAERPSKAGWNSGRII